jgi:cytochrome b561
MSLAYVFLIGEGILVWGHRTPLWNVIKAIHIFLNGLALLFIILGLVFVFKYHNDHGISNMFSLHSWIGLITVLLTFMQWCLSFMVFVWPGGTDYLRVSLKTFHRFFGYIIYGMAMATILLGLLQRLTLLSLNNNPISFSPEHLFGNITGLFILFSALLVFFQLFNKPPA